MCRYLKNLLIMLILGAGFVSSSQNVSEQIRSTHRSIIHLYTIKYRILLYGLETNQIDTSSIPELRNDESFINLLSRSISFRSLCSKFPRYSMLVESRHDKESSDDWVLGKIIYLVDLCKWNLRLCKALWMPTVRNETVAEIARSLTLPWNGFTFAELEESLDLELRRTKGLLNTISSTMSNKSMAWLSDFSTFSVVWEKVSSLIKQYESKFELLLKALENKNEVKEQEIE